MKIGAYQIVVDAGYREYDIEVLHWDSPQTFRQERRICIREDNLELLCSEIDRMLSRYGGEVVFETTGPGLQAYHFWEARNGG